MYYFNVFALIIIFDTCTYKLSKCSQLAVCHEVLEKIFVPPLSNIKHYNNFKTTNFTTNYKPCMTFFCIKYNPINGQNDHLTCHFRKLTISNSIFNSPAAVQTSAFFGNLSPFLHITSNQAQNNLLTTINVPDFVNKGEKVDYK